MQNSPQAGLFPEDQTIAQLFAAWKATPGGRHLLKYAYAVTARLLSPLPPGRLLSAKLVFELLRYRLPEIRARLAARGVSVDKVNGYALNNVFTAYIARHMMDRRPDWAGRFELRELNRPRKKRKVIVVEEQLAA